MIEVHRTEEFSRWLHRLRDDNAVGRIVARIRRAELGNLGDCRNVGGGVMEMRIDYPRLLRATRRRHRYPVVWR